MHQVMLNVAHYVLLHKDGLLALIGGGAGLSAFIQFVLVKFRVNGKKWSFILSHLFALLTAAAAFVVSNVDPNVGVTYGWIWVAAQFWHRFAVNPVYNRYVVPFLAWLEAQRLEVAEPSVPRREHVPDPNALAV